MTSSGEDEGLIRKVLMELVDPWNKHGAKGFAEVFAKDADFTNVRGDTAHGRREIEEFHAPLFATRFKDSHQTIKEYKIRFIRPDVDSVDAHWEMTGAKRADGRDIPLRSGLLHFVMAKESGKWFIVVMHNVDLTPLQ